MYERYVPRPPLKLPFMAICLFAAHFWILIARAQAVAGDPKFQRRRRILILTGFSLPYLSTFLYRKREQWWLTPEARTNICPPLLSRDGF